MRAACPGDFEGKKHGWALPRPVELHNEIPPAGLYYPGAAASGIRNRDGDFGEGD